MALTTIHPPPPPLSLSLSLSLCLSLSLSLSLSLFLSNPLLSFCLFLCQPPSFSFHLDPHPRPHLSKKTGGAFLMIITIVRIIFAICFGYLLGFISLYQLSTWRASENTQLPEGQARAVKLE